MVLKRAKEILKTPISYVMAVLAVVRILVIHLLGVWFPAGQIWDDSLVMEYADLVGHFHNPNRSALLKTMGYPVFLKVVSVSKLPYTVWLGIIWVVAALFVYSLVKRLNAGKRGMAFGFYVYTLFLPQAFDYWSGTRLYRTGMIAPFVIVTIVLMVKVLLDIRGNDNNGDICNRKRLTVDAILLGLCFSYTYYLKEDGMWLMACLLFEIVVALVILIVKNKKQVKVTLCSFTIVLIPIFIWVVATLGYKAVNYKYFGVFDINTRTESEYGKFIEKVYAVESADRSLLVWAPYSAIDSVFAASETLREHPALLEAIHNSVWAEDLTVGHEIPGDHFAFALREEMYELGMYKSESEVKTFFKRVNEEIDAAFEAGVLHKDDKTIQLLASTGGYTWSEIRGLFPLVKESFNGAVLLKEYNIGLGEVSDWEIENLAATVSFAKMMTHIDYLDDYSVVRERSDKVASYLKPLLMVYKSINAILFLSLLLSVLFEIVIFFIKFKSIKTFSEIRCKIFLEALVAFVLLGVSVCYAFSISWFSAFCYVDGINMTILNFYNIALPGLLTISYIFTSMIIKNEIVLMRKCKKGELHHV